MNRDPSPEFSEDNISKVPAILLLRNMGYTYLPPEEANRLRAGRTSNVLLEGILVPWLREHNHIQFKGETYPFSEGNILSAVQALREIPYDGLVRTNEKIYDLLSLGKSLQQSIDGDTRSFGLDYIDWDYPENNVFHVTEEFSVERPGTHETRRPDIVLFVNGIPLVVIECKDPSIKNPIQEAISQHIRNQRDDEIPSLFVFSQILMALSKNEAMYATTATPARFWSVWREQDAESEKRLESLCAIELNEDEMDEMFSSRVLRMGEDREPYGLVSRKVTEQDRALFALCRPERLLQLVSRYIIYDGAEKKIARYQQYFCVEKILKRIERKVGGKRQGGVVWHTQGSGKSLTMVYLAKSIAMDHAIPEYKIVLVTDRIDLDYQLTTTFRHCGKEVEQARSGKHLGAVLSSGKQRIVATVIDKFDSAVGKIGSRIDNPDIFVLVDEGHRGQYGPRHARMRITLPNACYIGFTGTPVMKKDRDTVDKFGGLIDTYTITRAVEDKAVVPLLYEGRNVVQRVDSEAIDEWFERVTENLSEEQRSDLKRKFATTDQLNKTEQKVMRTAWDISAHFRDTWQGTSHKGQIVAPDKATALLYKKYLDEFGQVTSEVLISGPDEREGEEDLYAENREPVIRFWKATMRKYGTEAGYNRQVVNAFKNAADPEIIIVVDKLLTGFDAPCNTVLYLTRRLKEHALLQAIARVNRLYEGKDFGYIIDYRGILESLDHALDLYSTLPEFDARDLQGILTDVSDEISKLPQRHSVLWDTFKEVKNKRDEEEYELALADEASRVRFYERLSAYSRTLAVALSTVRFLQDTPAATVERYRKDLKFFSKLRLAARQRYAETVDFSDYEPKIQKLLDTHVGTGEVEQITPLVNIFDKEAFAGEVQRLPGAAAKADTIAHRTKRTIHERMQEDPVFYRKFSELIEEAIRAYREERITANEFLKRAQEYMEAALNRTGDAIPDMLAAHEVAKAYYGIVGEILTRDRVADKAHLAQLALTIDEIIEEEIIVNWVSDPDRQNRIRTRIEDALFEYKEQHEIELPFEDIDQILDQLVDVAKVRRNI